MGPEGGRPIGTAEANPKPSSDDLGFFICRPDSLLVGILAALFSTGVYKGSKALAVGVVVSAFLLTPFLT